MKVLLINLGLFGSTGKIISGISDVLISGGNQAYMAYPDYPQNMPGRDTDLRLKVGFRNKITTLLEKTTGYQGCFAFKNTKVLIDFIRKTKPDVINLHNIHGMKINVGRLFAFLKGSGIPVVWTLHDCWSFTGQCPYFTLINCEKWKTGCHHCTRYREYPGVYVDRTKAMWKRKKEWFTGVPSMTIVTPSKWLADLAKQSYLSEYPILTINNGIDLSVFKPTEGEFRSLHGLEGKQIVLGVAYGWSDVRKGLDVFVSLAKQLDDEYRIVLVGTDDAVDKQLPSNILSVHRTQNPRELAELYTAADVFVIPTREENYPTVNMESIACGTPVLTFNTGGSPEIPDEHSGSVVDVDDVEALYAEIIRICKDKPYSVSDCLKRAQAFDRNQCFKKYLKLYGDILNDRATENRI